MKRKGTFAMRGMTERDKKLRLLYGVAFLVLMVVETLIALYVHDKVIRPMWETCWWF